MSSYALRVSVFGGFTMAASMSHDTIKFNN